MSKSILCPKPISALLTDQNGAPANYWIPAYQRGYRWSPLQVTQLLDDIWEFIQTSDGGQFYCLQPLVVKSLPDGVFEVVDGQQRLTTIFIILTCLRPLAPLLVPNLFRLTFETRGTQNEPFLAHIDLSREEENIDFFHICQAYRAVEKWREAHPPTQQLKLLQHLLNDDESGRNVKVIWFQLAESDNPVDAFTRLNVGKIPLTDDELIRALFLRQIGNGPEDLARQLQIANEWDQIEKALQENAFWYFLTNKDERPQSRIGFLFELIAESDGIPPEAEHDPNRIFYAFSKRMKGAKLEDEWLRIKEEFVRLQEWYEDETRVLYHVVGFLVNQGVSLAEIRTLSLESTKSALDRILRQQVFASVIGKWPTIVLSEEEVRTRVREKLEALEYGSPGMNTQIRSILLLFNIATLLLNTRSNLRFQFSSYKREKWDLEHVRSVSPDRLKSYDERISWMKACVGYLNLSSLHPKLQAEIQAFIALPRREVLDTTFAELYVRVLEKVDESAEDEPDNNIANLTLLDYRTNRSYKNAPFVVKRQELLSLDEAGTFVPLCTRNVFLKCYSPLVKNPMMWSEEDKRGYERAIIETLVKFFLDKTEVPA